MNFEELGLGSRILDAIRSSGYENPTPIQEKAIPHVLDRRDVLGIAQTGTGKTASFVLPMLSLLEKGRARARMPRTLILEPTRELAAQVEESFNRYGCNHKLTVALLIGGVSFDDQFRKLDRGADVLIATPGRLLDHFERGKLLMSGVEILVIDEADRMLDMGFIPAIERIVKLVPFTRQTLLFSATMPSEIESLARQFLQNPVEVSVDPPATPAGAIEQGAIASPMEDYEKRAILRRLIDEADDLKNAIVFCNRKIDVSSLWKSLDRHGYSCGALHGDMDQSNRTAMLHNFKENRIQLLVASDVAARGLDIPDVSHVFNFDVPRAAEDYVHRIGRTGRAGRSGNAMMLVTPADRKSFEAIESLIGESIEWMGEPVEWDDSLRFSPRRESSGRFGSRRPARGSSSSARRTPAEQVPDEDSSRSRTGTAQPPSSRTRAPESRDSVDRPRSEAVKRKPPRPRRSESDDSVVSGFGGEDRIPAFLLRQ